MYQKFEDNAAIVRDTENKAILAADLSALSAHIRQRDQAEKITKLEQQVDSMNEKMDLILRLLQK